MSQHDAGRVLAIGLDAMEATLVESMIKSGELPALQGLLQAGTWSRVTSPTRVSSGAVWPNFYTGHDECHHGHYSLWNWEPVRMGLEYFDASRLVPFWQELDRGGRTVGVIDVPFAPFLGLPKGFEVLEWGAHSKVEGRVQVAPSSLAETVAKDFPPHPFAHPLAGVPVDPTVVSAFLDDCIEGARTRGDLAHRLLTQNPPDLAIVIFPEAHHGGHFLWHTVERHLHLYDDLSPAATPGKTLADLYREMDAQVGRLVETTSPGTTVFVFALHGMAPSRGIPTVLDPLLVQLDMTHLQPRVSRGQAAREALKRRLPTPLRNIYRRAVPQARRSQWGRAAVLPPYDWSRTRAFTLPVDQYGHVRINLAGRESQGIVAAEDYTATCDVIEAALRELTTLDGRPVVEDVVRPDCGAPPARLPDLVVHWHRAAFESGALVNGVETYPMRREQTGQHAPDGFCIATGPGAGGVNGAAIASHDVHRVIGAALGP